MGGRACRSSGGFYLHPKFAASIRGPSRPDTHLLSPWPPCWERSIAKGWWVHFCLAQGCSGCWVSSGAALAATVRTMARSVHLSLPLSARCVALMLLSIHRCASVSILSVLCCASAHRSVCFVLLCCECSCSVALSLLATALLGHCLFCSEVHQRTVSFALGCSCLPHQRYRSAHSMLSGSSVSLSVAQSALSSTLAMLSSAHSVAVVLLWCTGGAPNPLMSRFHRCAVHSSHYIHLLETTLRNQ